MSFFKTDEKTMAWKNIKQKSLADGLMVNHAALEELDDVNEIIHWDRIESMLSDIPIPVLSIQFWEIFLFDRSFIKLLRILRFRTHLVCQVFLSLNFLCLIFLK